MKTTIDLENSSAQEVLDFVIGKLVAQGRRSEDNIGCLYRSANGKCAAGHLIKDEFYDKKMERGGWELVIKGFGFPPFHEDLIKNLQKLHDFYEPSDWAEITTVEELEKKLRN